MRRALRATPKDDWVITGSHCGYGRKPVVIEPESGGNSSKTRVESGPVVIEFENVTVLKFEFNVTAVFCEAVQLSAGDGVDFEPFDAETISIRVNALHTIVVGNQCWSVASQ